MLDLETMRKTISAAASVLLVAAVVSGQTRPAGPVKPVKPSPELLAMWAELEPKREAAAALAKAVTHDTMAQARKNRDELIAATAKFNEMLAPVAAGSMVRATSMAPKRGIERAIWLYKFSRQVALYNAANRQEMGEEEYRSIELVNDYREALGLVPLEFDKRLYKSAMGHSQWMKETDKCEHEEVGGRPGYLNPEDRISKAGYHWRGCGENVAAGQPTPEMAFRDWFESPGHHHNMVGDYFHIGIASVDHYWTQNFGSGERQMAPAYNPKPATRPAGAGATSRP